MKSKSAGYPHLWGSLPLRQKGAGELLSLYPSGIIWGAFHIPLKTGTEAAVADSSGLDNASYTGLLSFPVLLLCPLIPASWHHLPNKPPVSKPLSWALLLGNQNLDIASPFLTRGAGWNNLFICKMKILISHSLATRVKWDCHVEVSCKLYKMISMLLLIIFSFRTILKH